MNHTLVEINNQIEECKQLLKNTHYSKITHIKTEYPFIEFHVFKDLLDDYTMILFNLSDRSRPEISEYNYKQGRYNRVEDKF